MNAQLDELLGGRVSIEQVLLAVGVAFAVLLIVLRLVRWRRNARARQRHAGLARQAAEMAASAIPGQGTVAGPIAEVLPVRLFFLHPETPVPVPVAPAVPIAARPAPMAERVAALPVAAAPVVVPFPVRLPGRPRRESEETVLSPESLLARAHEHIAAGAPEEAAKQLRLCVRLASKLKQRETEAGARLELGDLARASGDLTTACEHWQLARALFTELERKDEMAAAERRMEQAACPTDWVLTQF